MNAQEFFELAKNVRKAQKDYFALQCDFVTVKKLENQFDKALQEGLDDAPTVHVYTTQEYQEQLDLMELDAQGDTPT